MKYKYTKYEISKLVKDKFKQSNLSKEEFNIEFENEIEAKETFELARLIFDEIIMQDKIGGKL
ncbi:MAG: hypothetical protein ACLR02_10020 [Clostridium sp.]